MCEIEMTVCSLLSAGPPPAAWAVLLRRLFSRWLYRARAQTGALWP
jgi:hypothetical protein